MMQQRRQRRQKPGGGPWSTSLWGVQLSWRSHWESSHGGELKGTKQRRMTTRTTLKEAWPTPPSASPRTPPAEPRPAFIPMMRRKVAQ
uniref:Uncharacterized protein n=1 Tax=Gasterosteus aculeatus TaxID=69293 RepID=G3PEF1_GASAC